MEKSKLAEMNLSARFLAKFGTCLVLCCIIDAAGAQPFSRTDSLHGSANKLVKSIDVLAYDIVLRVNPAEKFIQGSNTISARAIQAEPVTTLQLDLFAVMNIDSIFFLNRRVAFRRDSNIFLVDLHKQVKPEDKFEVTVYFSGHPPEAKHAPWDGGFVWSKDKQGNDWVGLACEGIGASCWLPCKDHLDDEPKKMDMRLQVPANLVGVSNGKLADVTTLPDGYKQWRWKVTYPINPYNISVNIANYAHVSDRYMGANGILPLDYYVLNYNRDTAQLHFKQVQGMLACFEKHFGSYPFWNDGYKLVETPYWGMEHQSCVAYGNNYKNNSWGFDFIIIHESGHEYFGNSLSMVDAAEMWIHESFTTYSETVYMECLHGKAEAFSYLTAQRKNIKNKEPMIGPYGVYYHGRADNDIYYKGAWVLQTMRHTLHNDTLWFNMLHDIAERFKYQPVTTEFLIGYINTYTRRNWDAFFKQYLHYASLPVLEYRTVQNGEKLSVQYRLKADVDGLTLPVRISGGGKDWMEVMAGSLWQTIELEGVRPEALKIDNSLVLIEVRLLKPGE